MITGPYHLGSDRRQGRRRAAGARASPRRSASIPRSAGSDPRRPSAGSCPGGRSIRASARAPRTAPLAPPFPDLLIASGRRAVPYLRFVKQASGGRTYTVFLKDPRTGPEDRRFHLGRRSYDRLRGPNVLTTLTPPHRVSAERLAAARAGPTRASPHLPHPRVAVLAGGDSRHHRFTEADIARFVGAPDDPRRDRRGPDDDRLAPHARRPCATALSRLARRAWRLLLGRHGREPLCRPCWRSPISSWRRPIPST